MYCICWIHCIDQPKTLLLKSKTLDFETLRRVHVYRIEYGSYRQGSYQIRIVSAACRIVPALHSIVTMHYVFSLKPTCKYKSCLTFHGVNRVDCIYSIGQGRSILSSNLKYSSTIFTSYFV